MRERKRRQSERKRGRQTRRSASTPRAPVLSPSPFFAFPPYPALSSCSHPLPSPLPSPSPSLTFIPLRTLLHPPTHSLFPCPLAVPYLPLIPDNNLNPYRKRGRPKLKSPPPPRQYKRVITPTAKAANSIDLETRGTDGELFSFSGGTGSDDQIDILDNSSSDEEVPPRRLPATSPSPSLCKLLFETHPPPRTGQGEGRARTRSLSPLPMTNPSGAGRRNPLLLSKKPSYFLQWGSRASVGIILSLKKTLLGRRKF